jgi:dUTP pyrophosphatase
MVWKGIKNCMNINVKKVADGAILPSYHSTGAAGFDLHSLEDHTFSLGETKLVRTGLAFQIPEGYEMQIRDRSGVVLKTPFRVANSPGTIDSDYRGEVSIIITNSRTPGQHMTGGNRVGECNYIAKGERIAQAVICPVVKVQLVEVENLEETKRGSGGFGHTGT